MSNLENQILDGMDIYDVDGAKIGRVVRYDPKLGYFETAGEISGSRYIPFYAIERIGPTGATLNVTKSLVSLAYKGMPSVTPDVTASGRLTGSGTVDSGYTGLPVPLDAAAIRVVQEQIHVGTSVFDSENKNLGTIEAYDDSTGYMRVEKGVLFPKDIFLPVTSVAFLDDRGVHLSEARDTIVNRFAKVPEVAREFFTS